MSTVSLAISTIALSNNNNNNSVITGLFFIVFAFTFLGITFSFISKIVFSILKSIFHRRKK